MADADLRMVVKDFKIDSKEAANAGDIEDKGIVDTQPFKTRHANNPEFEYEEEVIEDSDLASREVGDDELEADPYLEEAIAQGYDPDYDGPNKRTPEQFIEHGKVLNTIHKQNQRIRDLEENAKNHSEMLRKGMEKARRETLAKLKEERREAREDNDWDKVDEIEADMDELRSEPLALETETPAAQPATVISPERAAQFAAENPWMQTDREAAVLADTLANAYVKANPGVDAEQVIDYTLGKMKTIRTDLFTSNENRGKPSPVARQGRTTRTPASKAEKGKMTYADLDHHAKRACDLYVKVHKGKTVEDFIADFESVS